MKRGRAISMGRKGLVGSANVTSPLAKGLEPVTVGAKASQDTAQPSSHVCSGGQECLTCVSQVSGGEKSGAPTLLALARSVAGNARLRGMREVSIAESRSGAKVDLTLVHRVGGDYLHQAKGCGSWR